MTPSIPASFFVGSTPGVIGGGGSPLSLNGLALTASTRVPIGTVASFPALSEVQNFFGYSAPESAAAAIYFGGFINANQSPGVLHFAQYPWQAPVPAYLWGGSMAAVSLSQLQAISGVLTITIDGVSHTSSSINLSGATSFSAAAATIQSALSASDAVFTGAIAPAGGSFTGSIAATTLTVTAVGSGVLTPGSTISGTGVTAGTTVVSQLTGTPGGNGTYQVSASQTVSSTTITATSTQGVLAVSAVSSGTLAVGQNISGTGVTAGTQIVGELSGTGGSGTYVVNLSQTATSTTITAGATVTFDSVTSAFVITGPQTGAAGTIGFASGSIAAALMLTAATGAYTSQGAAIATPGAAMAAIVDNFTNFASFTTVFEPVTADKVAFAAWNNTQPVRYIYCMAYTDLAPTTSTDTTSASHLIQAAGYSGTMPIFDPNWTWKGFFEMGVGAAADFTEANGRITYAYKGQSGLPFDVTSEQIAKNLIDNGSNFYGSVATAAQQFQFLYPGLISGDITWADTYLNQISLDAAMQLAILSWLTTVKSVPYNNAGAAALSQVLATPIGEAVTFGSIVAGITLSSAQAIEVNTAAGLNIVPTLFQQGWYLQIGTASAQTRAARGSPPVTLWYCDGGSIQQLNIASIVIL